MSNTYEKQFGKGKSKITVPFKVWQVKVDSIRKLNRVGKDHVPGTVAVPAQQEEAAFQRSLFGKGLGWRGPF